MKIPSIGNYLTQDGQTAIVDELSELVCSGRIAHQHGSVTWSRMSGACLPFLSGSEGLSIVSPAQIPWRERIIQLIETARRDPTGSGRLISGDVTFYMDCCYLTVSRGGRHAVVLSSPELIGAFKTRITEQKTEASRAMDDTKAEAIEALLQ